MRSGFSEESPKESALCCRTVADPPPGSSPLIQLSLWISTTIRFLQSAKEPPGAPRAKPDTRISTASSMAAEVFVDTAGFMALWDASDEHHTPALRLQRDLTRKSVRFLTTDYILDETATLLRFRHSHAAAADFLSAISRTQMLRLEWVDSQRFLAAAGWFERHADKHWSFTDCVSFVVMHELKIQDAFTTDHHFTQAGFVALLRVS